MRRPDSRRGLGRGGDPQTVETAAVRLLARREHSVAELRRKLRAKGYEGPVIEAVLEKLAARRMLSDERYTASSVRHHAGRGHGPVRIRAELRQQGVAESSIQQKLDDAGVDWAELAVQVRRRRFGAEPPGALSERAKQARFLQYRGFSAEQIRTALNVDETGGLSADPGLEDPGDDPDPLQDEAAEPGEGRFAADDF